MSDYAQREEYDDIEEFPGYAVSNFGNVLYMPTAHVKRPSLNQQGIPNVILSRGHITTRRSVPLLVANAFVPKPRPDFDTPIHLDGDRRNCSANNLAWRPRWFAVKYHKQFHPSYGPAINAPIRDTETGVEYSDSLVAAMLHGLLDNEILLAIRNRTVVFPTGQMFEEIDW